MKKLKHISLLIVLMLSCTLLAACGSKGAESKEVSTDVSATSAADVANTKSAEASLNISNLNVGDTCTFGHYQQQINTEAKPLNG